jgi:sortase A
MTALGPQKLARKISRKTMITMLLIVLPLGGVWQIGQGAYIHAKAVLAQILLEAAWVDTLNGHKEVKPWPWADTWPVGRLTVPRLGISRIVLAGASGESLAFGPGLFSGNLLPDNGGNTVIAGHRDTHFRFLQDLRPGDIITLQTPDALVHDYHITVVKVVHETDAHYLADTEDALLTLVTCYPFDAIVPVGPLRYLVIARQHPALPL